MLQRREKITMSLLTKEEQAILDAWADDYPEVAADFFARLNQKLGPVPQGDPEELIRRFQIDAPALWLELMTSLRAQYSATDADVEREVGRVALANAGVQTATSAQLEAARAQGRLDATREAQRANTVVLIKRELLRDCQTRMGCDASFNNAQLDAYANFIAELTPSGFSYRNDIGKVVELVQRARVLDGTNRLIPSDTATELVFEAEFG